MHDRTWATSAGWTATTRSAAPCSRWSSCFEDSSTVDELGIGSVRDTFSNALFPGTSTLHTRVKYFLFVPWLINDVARHRWPVERALAELRGRETRLIGALLAGEESEGVIGRDARSTLKRMPSELYWASLGHVGVRRWRTSISGYFRNANQHAAPGRGPRRSRTSAPNASGWPPSPDAGEPARHHVLRPGQRGGRVPQGRIADATRGSLFAWLAVHHPASEAVWVWDHEARDDFPDGPGRPDRPRPEGAPHRNRRPPSCTTSSWPR